MITYHMALAAMAHGHWCGRISAGVWELAPASFKPGHVIMLLLDKAGMLKVATHDFCRGAVDTFTCQARTR